MASISKSFNGMKPKRVFQAFPMPDGGIGTRLKFVAREAVIGQKNTVSRTLNSTIGQSL